MAAAAEPVPPFVAGFERFARHGEIEPAVAGRLLLAELSCAACHAGENVPPPKRGPRLDGAGDRLRPEWVRSFVADPARTKPGTTMPDVLAGLTPNDRERTAAALAAFLASLGEPFPEFPAGGANPLPHEFWGKGNVERGRDLHHRVGCVACHAPDPEYAARPVRPSPLDELLADLDPEEVAELGLGAAARAVPSVPRADLAAKSTRKSLTHFLIDPARTHPAGRMPNLELEPVEAADVAAYLLRDQPADVEVRAMTGDAALVAEGRRLFEKLSCAACHDVQGMPKPAAAKPLATLRFDAARSCLGEASFGLPRYVLDEEQTRSLREAIGSSGRRDRDAAERIDFTLLSLNCHACHERGGKGGVGRDRRAYFETVGQVDMGDEGRLPPPLDRVGWKLEPAWIAKVLAGEGDTRPYLFARMPRFPKAAVVSLPADFAAVDLAAAEAAERPSAAEVFGDFAALADEGRQLVDTGCVQCHPLRAESVPGTVGIDLAGVTERVRPDWFEAFLRDPAALKPRTRMPTFFPNGTSANPTVLEGDVDRQIAAMWAYLADLERQPLPAKIAEARSRDFELLPRDRPIVLRTFSKEAGTRTIAVGFPQGVHLFFDANNCRPALAWRGRFLDAYSTWFDRFATPAEPLGAERIAFPPGATTTPDVEPSFRGYRLDENGVPTFLYRSGALDVEDRFEPQRDGGLRRRVTVTGRTEDAGTFSLLVHSGRGLVRRGETAVSNAAGLTVTIPESDAEQAIFETRDGIDEWRLALESGRTIELEYRW